MRLLPIFFILNILLGYSQGDNSFSFKQLSGDNEDMPSGALGITQDSLGFIWMASVNGLNKYDGKAIKFFPKNFVSESDIIIYDKKIYTDREKNTWIITGERIIEKLNSKEETFTAVGNIPMPKVLYQSQNLNYFVGTSNNGIFKINHVTNDTIQILEKKDIPVNVNEFAEFKNIVWASTTSGIYKITPDNKYIKYKIPIVDESHTTVIGASENYGVFVGTYLNRVFKYNETTDKFQVFNGFPKYPLPENLYIHNLVFDSKDRLWIGSYGQGLFLVNFKEQKILNFKQDKLNPNTIPYDCIIAIYEDATNNIWIGTDGGGLCLYDEKLQKFNELTNDRVPNDVNLSLVKSVDIDDNGGLWMGTHNYGIINVDSTKNRFKTYDTENSGLTSNKIAYLKFIERDLWIANETPEIQILKPDGSIDTFNRNSKPKLDVGYIYHIFQDSEKRVWLSSSDSGLIQFDSEIGIVKQYRYNAEDINSLSSDLIYSIAEDSNKGIWIGTKYKGLCRIDQKTDKIKRYHEFDGLARYLYIDSEDMIWIATNTAGLIKFNPKTREKVVYDRSSGIAGSTICAILPDGDNLWLSSNQGVTKFDTKTLEVENYDQLDGLQSAYFATRSAVKDQKRNLFYFGGSKGINWFNPNNIEQNTSLTTTIITKVEVNEKTQSIFKPATYQHHENTINFTFNSLHYSSPNRNNFKYKLVNYDENWQEAKTINFVRYTNLPPNDYEFQVISSNYDDVWNETPATYHFTILKPWYTTNLAYIIYGLLIIACLYVFYRYLQWRLQIKNELEFEHKEAERLKKLDEFKNRLFTNISHEFRTPLTLISGPIENQLSKPDLKKEDREVLTMVERNAGRLLNLVNQILDLSKLETGNLKLSVAQENLELLLKQLVSPFKFKAKEKQINFTYSISKTNNVWFDKDVIEKIVLNLLSNALKYAPENGFVRFEALIQKDHLVISVTNNGVIYSKDDLQKLFNRYYQSDRKNDGAGIGLALVKELAILSRGNIVANMLNRDEIQFTVTLPVERTYFNSSEISSISAKVAENKNEEIKGESPIESQKNVSKNKPILLLVEDDDDIRLYVKSIFKNNYKIIEAVNGKQGIEKAFKTIPDLIISDVMMPIEDGISLCNTLKQDERTSHVPIILLTAKSENEHEIEGLKTGADDYITKPFKTERLKIKVEKLMENRIKLQKHFSKTLSINPELAITSTEVEFLKRLQTVLDKHITDPEFTSDQFVKLMQISRSQLHRKLKAITNMTTSEFIRSQRLKLAKELLIKSDATISEIAYQVGFNTPSYFIKCFKEIYHFTPNEFQSKAL
ncbi:hybrid sensor histidine kinase/response regulator transcription factor [Patiriisocius hiemis]|uniref:histidine kinase n=1 Tax=Patiriisocius hiemis TaxID=3075604 RepID=A0ABU2YC18_9FLAO|nr:response regulator [Constantimarinum sp. W242]MDT0555194.1 response regulator [Constantimarinum sp. W242]